MNKKTIYRWHRSLGVSLGLILFILGLSGAVVTYRDELLPRVYPELFYVKARGPRAPVEAIIKSAQLFLASTPATHLYTSERSDTATMLFSKPDGSLLPTLLTIDPYSAKVIGQMPLVKNIFGVALYVHANLLLGKVGSYLVGIMGILLTLFFITGVMIFWGKNVRQRIKRLPKSGLRGWHRGVGLFLGLPLVFSAITGFILAFDLLGDSAKPKDMIRNDHCSFKEQVEALRLLSPKQKENIISVHFCSSKNSLLKVSYGHESRDGHQGFSKILIDPKSQSILQKFDTRSDPPAWTRNALTVYPLHTGSYFGAAGRIVTLMTGFALMSLYITGLLAYVKARKNKKLLTATYGLEIPTGGLR